MPAGSGKVRLSQVKSHQWNSRIQKQSKWNTDNGRSRSAMPVDELGDRLLVVRGRERGAQPQPERPARRQCGSAGQCGVLAEDLLGRGPMDHQIFQRLAGHAELHPRHRLGADLERDQPRVIDEHAVPAVGQVERHVLVRLFAAGAAVGVPDVHDSGRSSPAARTARPGRTRTRRCPRPSCSRM